MSLVDLFTVVAVLRRRVLLSRRHRRAAALPRRVDPPAFAHRADNLGLGLVVLGLLPRVDGVVSGLKLVAIWLIALLASGAVSQLIARAAQRGPPA
jgi:multicomponent Na+:H+ antiporter subunit G